MGGVDGRRPPLLATRLPYVLVLRDLTVRFVVGGVAALAARAQFTRTRQRQHQQCVHQSHDRVHPEQRVVRLDLRPPASVLQVVDDPP